MKKPTLFFSHSSKDKDMILYVKNKIMEFTGSTLDIFMSSDGQSIPFGTNWTHKIEEGLNDAKIMFVFVTENSVSSGWIYFEAGFAYSKGIQVIPVGVDIDVGGLKAPLNLLQGFNIISSDSLNNFISIINKTFDYKFDEKFSNLDYNEFTKFFNASESSCIEFEKVVKSIDYDLYAEHSDDQGEETNCDIDAYFNKIADYLNDNNISYSLQNSYYRSGNKCLTVKGIKIVYRPVKPQSSLSFRSGDQGKITVKISPYNFEESFELYEALNELLDEKESFYIRLRLSDKYMYVPAIEDITALIYPASKLFKPSQSKVGSFDYEQKNLKFSIFNVNQQSRLKESDYVMSIQYVPKNKNAKNIVELVKIMLSLNVIRKNQGGFK